MSRQKKKIVHKAQSAKAAKAECIFCPDPAGSKEHMIPAWLLKENRGLLSTRTKVAKSAFVGLRKDGSEYVMAIGQNPEVIDFHVCRTCNEGWMKGCEASVAPFLKPMMRGERRDLSPKEQFSFSMWLLKTAMVMDGSENSETKFFTKEERYALRENYGMGLSKAPPFPNSMHAWLGAYSGPDSISVEGHIFHWLHGGEKETQISAYAFTLLFGHVFGQVLVAHVPFDEAGLKEMRSPKVNLAQGLLFQTFKPRELSVIWPPQERIGESGVTLEDLVLRWGGKGKLQTP